METRSSYDQQNLDDNPGEPLLHYDIQPRKSDLSSGHSHTRGHFRMFFKCLLVLMVSLWAVVTTVAALTILKRGSTSAIQFCDDRLCIAEDFTANVPKFQTKLTTFDLMESGYLPNPSNATPEENWKADKMWSGLMPVGNGFVLANKNTEHLPEAQWVPPLQEILHEIAVYHQIYCLTAILMAYNQTVHGHPQEWDPIANCLNYLRIFLMCHADTTLEGRDDDPTTQRVCKDYGEVRDWAQAHRRKPKKMPISRQEEARSYHELHH